MTAVGLLARLRTLFDEDVPEFWTDSVCYTTLSDAQREIINIVTKKFRETPGIDIPLVLRPLLLSTTQTGLNGQSFPLPPNFFDELSLKISVTNPGTQFPTYRRLQNENKYYHQNNSYLKSSNTDIFYDILPPNLLIESALVNGSITMDYIIRPADIDGIASPNVDPLLDDIAENAMIHFAFAFLLNKSKQYDRADAEMTLFTNFVGLL